MGVWQRYPRFSRATTLVLAVLVVAACVQLSPSLMPFVGEGRFNLGWDLQVVCGAYDAVTKGADPYVMKQDFTLPYSILHVYAVSPLCRAPEPAIYCALYLTLAAVSALLVLRLTPNDLADRAIVLVMFAGGLHALQWQLSTGNVSIIEWPLAALTVYFAGRKRFAAAGVAFGLLSSLKLLPIVGAAGFLLLPQPMRTRLLAFASAIGAFLAVQCLNAVLFWQYLPGWWKLLTNRLPGGAAYEGGDIHNPNLIDLVTGLLNLAHITHPVSEFVFICLGLGAGWLATLACLRGKPDSPMQSVAVLSIAVLVIWLFLFRQKPYAFGTFIPFLLVAAYSAGFRTALATTCVAVIVPAALMRFADKSSLPREYYQMISLVMAVGTVLVGRLLESPGRDSPLPVSGAELSSQLPRHH